MTPKEIDAKRKKEGVCRHCGGRIPCWSPSGDQRVGVKHSAVSLKKHLKSEANRWR